MKVFAVLSIHNLYIFIGFISSFPAFIVSGIVLFLLIVLLIAGMKEIN